QAGREHGGGWGQDEQADGHRAAADQDGGEDRGDAADEQVLGGVHVGDQPGEQVPGPEQGHPGGGQRLQPPPDRHPHLGQHPERDVVGGQPFQVTGHAAADAERADRDHGHRDRDDGGVLGRPGQQEPGDGEQRDAAAGGGGSGRHREQQPAAQRAGYRQQPQQRRPAVPGLAGGHGPGGHG